LKGPNDVSSRLGPFSSSPLASSLDLLLFHLVILVVRSVVAAAAAVDACRCRCRAVVTVVAEMVMVIGNTNLGKNLKMFKLVKKNERKNIYIPWLLL
jgi:hypothetical protein